MTTIASLTDSKPPLHLATLKVVFRKILVAVDFSAATPTVLRTALAVASCFDSEILLVNAATPAMYGTGLEPMPIETFEVNLDLAKALMKDLVEGEPVLREFQHREVVRYGSAVDLVQELAQSEKIDLILVGSHGAAGMQKLALGSTAEAIMRGASCPTLIIGPHCHPRGCPFKSVLLAADLTPSSLRATQYASALAEEFHSEFILLHVIDPRKNPAGTPLDELGESARSSLRALLPRNLEQQTMPKLYVDFGDPGEIVSVVSIAESSTVIVAGVREDSALGSHSPWSMLSQLIRQAHCPVMVLRRGNVPPESS